MSVALEKLQNMGFSESARVGVKAALSSVRMALLMREGFHLSLVNLADDPYKQMWAETFMFTKADGSKGTMGDVMATVEFHQEYFKHRPWAFSLTEEFSYLSTWRHIFARCLNKDNWRRLFESEDSIIADGIDGSIIYESGMEGCGVWVMGLSGWAVYAAIPSFDDYIRSRVECPFLSVAEIGVGVAAYTPQAGCQRVAFGGISGLFDRVAHGVTIHTDPRYAPLYRFLEETGGSKWIFSIGHAIGQLIVSGQLGLYIHGELAPHDYHPARVFFEALGAEHFTFAVDQNGNFEILPQGFHQEHCNPLIRLGICGGCDSYRVGLLRAFIERKFPPSQELLSEFRQQSNLGFPPSGKTRFIS